MQLVMLETNGNQRYIFAAPRLRDSIGASAQLVRLKEWTDDALRATGAAKRWEKNHPQPRGGPDPKAELPCRRFSTQWVSRASGKVIFMVDRKEDAKAVIGRVTRTALAQAPGMDVSGVHLDMGDKTHVDEDLLKRIHARAARYGLRRPPAEARFSQMPFLARAKDSVLPASPTLKCMFGHIDDEAKDDQGTLLSLPSRVKRYRAFYSRRDLISLACRTSEDLNPDQLVRDPKKLTKKLREAFAVDVETPGESPRPNTGAVGRDSDGGRGAADEEQKSDVVALEKRFQDAPGGTGEAASALSKVAVIHIDGNGVGAVMRRLGETMDRVDEADFSRAVGCSRGDADALRRFVLTVNDRLDRAVTEAFAKAWADVAKWAEADAGPTGQKLAVVPVVPVILGGDDVTVFTSGDYALPFAAAYLERYERTTESDVLLRHLGRDKGTGPMTAAAGVAVVRRDFPFHVAYNLAERLVGEAKKVGKAQQPVRSTLTYHALFDSSVLDPEKILQAYSSFTTRPFLLRRDGAPASDPPGRYEPWPDTCGRVRQFKGLTAEDPGTGETRFPKTRAARIRKLLSDAAQARLVDRGLSDRLANKAEREWDDAKKVLSGTVVEGMGTRALFDLMELSDLLPDSYLHSPSPADGSEPATTQEVQE
ncbi:Cas10/Cmr2 second palm domain-containing protein [Actinomyces sp. oral taxon 414]|uniref:Cas10/Cmr2 second palm domain-containing protein n=1 Tax=Actinomyces sp. oral taxon 414 TaxID=712122 RepID=UPI0006B03622|nr:hypothetical protein [Actinomyces sp. oral taxon 414]